MLRSLGTAALGAAALVLALASPGTAAGASPAGASPAGASAAGAQHEVFVEQYDGYESHPAEENPCGPWAMTTHEIRDGSFQVLMPAGGQVDGEFHVNGAVDGWIQITPDDPTLPTYTGSYREKLNGIITGYDEEEGDLVRVMQYRMRVPLTGSDGSSLVLALSGKLTLDAQGRMVVARDRMTCS